MDFSMFLFLILIIFFIMFIIQCLLSVIKNRKQKCKNKFDFDKLLENSIATDLIIIKLKKEKEEREKHYNNLSEDEINKVKKKAKELMLECGVKPPTDEWQKPIIKSIYECCYKYIAIRTMYKKELLSVGLNITGVVRSKGEYISLDKFKEILGVR